jgi:hypothetical protein
VLFTVVGLNELPCLLLSYVLLESEYIGNFIDHCPPNNGALSRSCPPKHCRVYPCHLGNVTDCALTLEDGVDRLSRNVGK